ncbi:MAG: hypothetical protein SPI79_18315 [Escherichia coli]|nr:hypothetical protein [Escherichia coli]
MAYSILHLSRNNQRTHLIVDDVTTLPVMFATIYGMNELSKKHLGTQENILCSLRFFYVYYFKKHKRTFDYDFYRSGYNISCYIRELDGFFTYLLGKQHLSDETDIISKGFLHSALSRTNKSTYGNHVRNVGRFLKYLNYRYMNLAYQDMSPTEAHQINQANHRDLADRIKVFNRVEVSRNEPAHRYKSITSQQSVELTNMLIPSTPEFTDIETGELIMAVVNPQNPFDSGFQQYRNYLIHRLMFNYGLRVGEVQLLLKDCVGPTLPDARGNIRFILIVQNLPDDVVDPRKQQPSLKTEHSQRQIELTEDDFIMFTIYMEQYRSPLFEEKKIDDHEFVFIKGSGRLTPLTYDAIRTFYKENRFSPQEIQEAVKNDDYQLPVYTASLFRHNVGHSMAMSGASAPEIAYILGQSSYVVADRYIAATPELADIREAALGRNPVFKNMMALMLTGNLVHSSEWEGRSVAGSIGGRLHYHIGGCNYEEDMCPFAQGRGCYGCLYFKPFIDGNHKEVFLSLNDEIQNVRDVADDAGVLNHPLLKELVRRKEHVNQVMARIEMAKAGGLFNR